MKSKSNRIKNRTSIKKVKPDGQQRRKNAMRWFVDIIAIIIGSLCFSAGLHCFTAPNDIAPGGVGGIATIINTMTGINIGLMFGIMNIPLLIIGLIFLGKRVMIKTVIAVVVITFATDYAFAPVPVYENGDRLLASIFGGVLFGVGMGLIYVCEGTSGGTDIVIKLINRHWQHFRIGVITMALDAVIVAASMIVYQNIESGLYAIISIFIAGRVMDSILYGTFEGKMLLIFSDSYEEISNFIMHDMNRGVTLLDGTGAYSGNEKHVICCAVHKNEYSKIKRRVNDIDSSAFIIISNAGEVLGDGFHKND